jgi:hypothetical protein
MSALKTLERFASLRTLKNEDHTRFLLGRMQGMTDSDKKPFFAQSKRAGGVYVYEAPDHPGQILEVVAGVRTDDMMACLYEPHPCFATPGELLKAREELIELLERLHQAVPGTLYIDDRGRGRKVELRELATMQLVDMIGKRFRQKGF